MIVALAGSVGEALGRGAIAILAYAVLGVLLLIAGLSCSPPPSCSA
jgi:hypothetical protein